MDDDPMQEFLNEYAAQYPEAGQLLESLPENFPEVPPQPPRKRRSKKEPEPPPPEPPYPPPQAGLSEKSAALWSELGPKHAKTIGRQQLFEQALRSLDRADEAARLLTEQGLVTVTKTTGAQHINPLTRVERDSRQQFARLWAQLGLDHAGCSGFVGIGDF